MLSLHGMPFDNDAKGRLSLFRMFRSSLYHLCLHAAVSDFGIYSEAARERESNESVNATFAMSIVEDFAVRGYASSLWPGLLSEMAYSNYLSCLRFRNFDPTPEELEEEEEGEAGSGGSGGRRRVPRITFTTADRIAANILSYTSISRPIAKIDASIDAEIRKLNSELLSFESLTSEIYSKNRSRAFLSSQDSVEWEEQKAGLSELKLKLFGEILSIFEKERAILSTAHSIPHHESYGPNLLFGSQPSRFKSEDQVEMLAGAMKSLGIVVPSEMKAVEDQTDIAETELILGTWEYSVFSKNTLLEQYKKYDPVSHFESIASPRKTTRSLKERGRNSQVRSARCSTSSAW